MIVKKNLSIKSIYEFTGHHLYWLTGWMSLVTATYYVTHWTFVTILWPPLSLIGTAVAFYVGFKNNHSYERLWEARQVWGAITNNSRKFVTMIKNYRSEEAAPDAGMEIRRQMVFRHIAYLYQLREQLFEPAEWEHVGLKGHVGNVNRKRRARNIGYYKDELNEIATRPYLADGDKNRLGRKNNKAVQLLDFQSETIQQLYQLKVINMIQQIDLQGAVNGFYDEQGKVERIKRFPFPRKYASFSFIFVCIFIFLLPFGIVGEFSKLGNVGVWLSIPIGVIVGWVYIVMEMIGDYSENPFEGLHNDVPMLSICRNIEIDLLQMIEEPIVPKPIHPKADVLF